MEINLSEEIIDRLNSQDRELEKDLGKKCIKRRHLIYNYR